MGRLLRIFHSELIYLTAYFTGNLSFYLFIMVKGRFSNSGRNAQYLSIGFGQRRFDTNDIR